MIIFHNLQEDKILSNQHLLDANHIKRTAFDVLLLKILYLVKKKSTSYLSYCITTGLKMIFFNFVVTLFIQKKDTKTKFKGI